MRPALTRFLLLWLLLPAALCGGRVPSGAADGLISDLTPKRGRGSPPPNARGMGPWSTRLMLAISTDGLTFTRTGEVLSDQAGVPDAVVDAEGRPRVYYIDWGNGNVIACAVRVEPARWTYRRVTIEGLLTGGQPVDPTVVLLPDRRLRLYYMQATPLPTVYSAVSEDGFRFTREPGVRFGPRGEPVFDPVVLRTGTRWRIWTGPDGRFAGQSEDGLEFTEEPGLAFEGRAFMPWSAVALPKGGYRLYGSLAGPGGPGIRSAHSADGRTWRLEEGSRLADGGNATQEAGITPDNGATVLPDGTVLMAYLAVIPR